MTALFIVCSALTVLLSRCQRLFDPFANNYVCVQPRSSAVNTALPAFAAERRRLLSIDISWQRGAQQQTRRTPLLLSIDGTDRRTDERSTVS